MSKNIRNEIINGSNSSYTSIVSQPYYYQLANIAFQGAIGPMMQATCSFERIGNTVTFTYPTMHQFQQGSGGPITGLTVPTVFRPSIDRVLTGLLIIHGSLSGGSATSAVTTGVLKVWADGALMWGTSINNDSMINGFGSAGTNGSGNGIIENVVTYSI